jgi:hypothetical protein
MLLSASFTQAISPPPSKIICSQLLADPDRLRHLDLEILNS